MNKKVAEAYIRKSGIFLGKYGEELNKKAVELISSMATFLNDTLAEAKLNSKIVAYRLLKTKIEVIGALKKKNLEISLGGRKVTRAIALEKLRILIRSLIYQLICLNCLLVGIRILDMSQGKK